jgi:hypothetical protein
MDRCLNSQLSMDYHQTVTMKTTKLQQQLMMPTGEHFQFQQQQEQFEDRSLLSADVGHYYYRKKNYWRQ